MKTTGFPAPVNDLQTQFRELCEKGGGAGGGPPRGKVQELLRWGGKKMNDDFAHDEIAQHLAAHPDANPWYVCFAVGLAWGHLAKLEPEFTAAAVRLLTHWNGTDLYKACSFHMERGPQPIHDSLSGAYQLFERVKLPDRLPDRLESIARAQERWLTPILSPSRPPYIGSWNATAMFMVAVFAQPHLADTMLAPPPMLPPNGPIFNALKLLHRAHVLNDPPSGSELDDEAFEPGAIYVNNGLMAELVRGQCGWNMLDLHSGLYLLGTRYPLSNQWLV